MIYIIRHGETEWNRLHKVQGHTDIPLNEYGRHLARETAEGMKDLEIDMAFTSPLLRAKETAQIIVGKRNIPLYEEKRIMEIGFGSYEGIFCAGENADRKSEEFNLFFKNPEKYIPPENAETISRLYERTGDFLKEICSDPGLKGKNILVSTHGAAMTAMLNRMKGNLSIREFWKDEVPVNCAVTMAEIRGNTPVIVREGVVFYKEKIKKWKTV